MSKETVKFIESKGKVGMKLGLENIGRLLNKLGNPQDKLTTIHIAGSNGKGSISRILENILTENGYQTGLYSSPHLEVFNERIRLNKENITDEKIDELFTRVNKAGEELVSEGFDYPTGFEIETAMAFLYFLENNADIIILEVGLGGRLDATNIIKKSLLSIISSISLEHTQWLGDTLEEIALEKSAIIKEGSHVIISPQLEESVSEVIAEDAITRGASSVTQLKGDEIKLIGSDLSGQTFSYNSENYHLPLLGTYQKNNFLTALEAAQVLNRNGFPVDVKKGLESLKFPGRFEILHRDPIILLDGAHNVDGLTQFVSSIKSLFGNQKIIVFFGILKDKKVEESLKILLPVVKKIYLLKPDSPDALSPEELKKIIKQLDPSLPAYVLNDYQDIPDKINLKDKDEICAVTGSLYLIGPARIILTDYLSALTV